MLTLRWRDIGADAINLRDSKTGPRAVPLGEAARAHIDALPGDRNPDAFLCPKLAEGRYSHNHCCLLAGGLRGCKAWQATPA